MVNKGRMKTNKLMSSWLRGCAREMRLQRLKLAIELPT